MIRRPRRGYDFIPIRRTAVSAVQRRGNQKTRRTGVPPVNIFFNMRILFLILLIFLSSLPAPQATDLFTFTDEKGATYYTNMPGDDRVKVLLPMKKAMSQPSSIPSSLNSEVYEPIITSAGERFAVDPDLVRAVIKTESNFNHRAVSPKGAMGLMQLMPSTAKEMAVANPFDPVENIHAGVRYLGQLLQLLKQNLPLALAAYNAGPKRVIDRNEIPAIEETQNYVQRVMKYYNILSRSHE